MNWTVGSVCSGIEAASVAWSPLGFDFKWFSEIASFPSMLLLEKYPTIPNLGDMNNIPDLIKNNEIDAPDIICGGTPCQAFSFAGWQKGLHDDRGNLTLRFVDIVNENDAIREKRGQKQTIVFWENVEGVLSDKTNAFGCFISSLAGLNDTIQQKGGWPTSGFIRGQKRTVAWRVLDAKYFGIPQQRRRLYVIAGDEQLRPELILFEKHNPKIKQVEYQTDKSELSFIVESHQFEIFREYTDCLFASYATKWNGNASANNGSLFVVQDERIRRLSPLECERLMGFPDGYTNITGAKKSNRYQALGNSWAVPVIKWLGKRILSELIKEHHMPLYSNQTAYDFEYHDFSDGYITLPNGEILNCSDKPERIVLGDMRKIVSAKDVPDIYLSPVGCAGIIRRSKERNMSVNPRLLKLLSNWADTVDKDIIEQQSRKQKRGRYSNLGIA